MILAKLDSKLNVKYKRMFSLASQLKAGKGNFLGRKLIKKLRFIFRNTVPI